MPVGLFGILLHLLSLNQGEIKSSANQYNHRIIASLSLGKTSKIIKSNRHKTPLDPELSAEQ